MPEARVVWVPYTLKHKSASKMVATLSISYDKTVEAESEIKKLVAEGFRIVATVPVLGSYCLADSQTLGSIHTTGYEVWLQR